MFIYLSGKIINILDSRIVIKLPNGIGYFVYITPRFKYIVNETIDLYVVSENNILYGLPTFDDYIMTNKLIKLGISVKQTIEIVYEVGADKLRQLIVTKDEVNLKKIPNFSNKIVDKLLILSDDEVISTLRSSDIGVNKDKYTAPEFTDKLQSLGYSRNRIVATISILKKEEHWGVLNLIDLIKKAIDILEQRD